MGKPWENHGKMEVQVSLRPNTSMRVSLTDIASIIQLAVPIINITSTSCPYPTLNVYCSYCGLSMMIVFAVF